MQPEANEEIVQCRMRSWLVGQCTALEGIFQRLPEALIFPAVKENVLGAQLRLLRAVHFRFDQLGDRGSLKSPFSLTRSASMFPVLIRWIPVNRTR